MFRKGASSLLLFLAIVLVSVLPMIGFFSTGIFIPFCCQLGTFFWSEIVLLALDSEWKEYQRTQATTLPPVICFCVDKTTESQSNCSICMEEFENGDLINPTIYLESVHEFHWSSINFWLPFGKTTYPNYRKELSIFGYFVDKLLVQNVDLNDFVKIYLCCIYQVCVRLIQKQKLESYGVMMTLIRQGRISERNMNPIMLFCGM